MSEKTAEVKKKTYETFAEQVIKMLENGTAPWQKSWKAGELHTPRNGASGKVYNGINRVMLAQNDYADPRWMTFRQANENGFRVAAGSKHEPIVHWQWTKKVDRLDEEGNPVLDENGKPEKMVVPLEQPRVQFYAVFHASKLRLENGEAIPPYAPEPLEWNPHDKAEAILQNSGAAIHHDQRDRAFYRRNEDAIHLPLKAGFEKAGDYYNTALHELAHWACAESRLNIKSGPFGSEDYAKNELRAEIGSWMLCQDLGLDFKPEDSAAYVKNWMQVLKDDPYEIVRACRDAEKIKQYLMGLEQGLTQSPDLEGDVSAEAAKAVSNPAAEKVYLNVPFREKEAAKGLGATWDPAVKKWCARPGADLDKLAQWLPSDEPVKAAPAEAREHTPEIAVEKVFLQVPYNEKNQAKAFGAKWDSQDKLWFAPAGADIAPLAKWIPEKEPASAPNLDPVAEFSQELESAGLKLDGPPVMDGQIHRLPVEGGKTGTRDGAYCAHLDGVPNGWHHNHKTGEHGKWVATGQRMSPEQVNLLKAENAQRRAERKQERERGYDEAAHRIFLKIGESATRFVDHDHPYLKAKGVKPFSVGQDQEGNLLVVGVDLSKSLMWRASHIQTLQTITEKGRKQFEPGSKKAGAMHLIDDKQFYRMVDDQKRRKEAPLLGSAEPQPEILLAEGYATGATLHMATGKPVAVAFDAGNLKAVAIQLREKFPEAKITICADNDHQAIKNVGLEKALDAAQAVQGRVVIPPFTDEEKKKGLTDFNDLHQSRGLQAVTEVIAGQTAELAAAPVPTKDQGVGR